MRNIKNEFDSLLAFWLGYTGMMSIACLMSLYLSHIGELDRTDMMFFILILSVYWKVEARQ